MDYILEKNRIYFNNESGKLIAEIIFENKNDSMIDIKRTFVDPSVEGQGIAGKLMESLVLKLKEEGKKAYPTCPYAIQWFKKNPNYSDLIS